MIFSSSATLQLGMELTFNIFLNILPPTVFFSQQIKMCPQGDWIRFPGSSCWPARYPTSSRKGSISHWFPTANACQETPAVFPKCQLLQAFIPNCVKIFRSLTDILKGIKWYSALLAWSDTTTMALHSVKSTLATAATDWRHRFESSLALSAFLGVAKLRMTTYHPMVNRLVEHFHCPLKVSLQAQEDLST